MNRCNIDTKNTINTSKQQHQMSYSQLQLRLEYNKRQKLHSQLSSIRQQLLSLKHTSYQLSHLIHTLLTDTDLSPTTQLIHSKITQLIQSIPHIKSLKSLLGKQLLDQVQLMPELMEMEHAVMFITGEELVVYKREEEVERKVMMGYQWLKEINKEIELIREGLHKRERQADLNDKLMAFLQQINNKYRSIITPQQFTMLQNLQFTEFSLLFHTQITNTKQNITDLKNAIIELRDRYIQIDASAKDIGDTQIQLQKLENQHEQMNKEIVEIQRYNENLQSNMQEIVHSQVLNRMDTINIQNCQQANKYLLAGQYILEKFGAILDKEQLADLYSQVDRLVESVHQKIVPSSQ